jgi:lactoylglutathione lyase
VKFGKAIVYVANVPESLAFFENAFGLKTRFVHESSYGEVETGGTTLAFASHQVGQYHLPPGYVAAAPPAEQMSFEIALVTESVEDAFRRAVAAGAQPLQEPQQKPWGQTGSYLRCPDGTFVDLSSPMPA